MALAEAKKRETKWDTRKNRNKERQKEEQEQRETEGRTGTNRNLRRTAHRLSQVIASNDLQFTKLIFSAVKWKQ
jgi:hypothetical protein